VELLQSGDITFKEVIKIMFDFASEERSRDSLVGIATSYGLDDRGVGVRVPVG
jgi:hypothetical protein